MVKKAAHATPNRLLRAARKERGWTQQQVADRIGAPLSLNISRWENGAAFPSAYYLERLCQLFGKNARELGLSQIEGQVLDEDTSSEPTRRESMSSAQTASKGEQEEVIASTSADQQDRYQLEKSPRVWMIPYPRNMFFLGREEVLVRLRQQLQVGRAMAISGLGGVGKTQVVLEYAYRHAEEYQMVFWVRADSRDALVAGYLEIAQALSLPERDERDQSVMISAVKGWLGQHSKWLLILDNADSLDLLPEFLPAPTRGHLLLTTRAQALGRLANRIELEALDEEAAALLLLRRAGLLALDVPFDEAEQIDRQTAVVLAQELGGLPLALDQAGAYVEETRCSFPHYLELYRSHRAELLRQRGGVVLDHPDSVATTWSLSFALVEQRSMLAADLLRLCALLHPDAIPEELFLKGAAYLGPTLATIESDPLAFNQALAVIGSYSLLRRSSREHILSVHRLVQAVLADAMSTNEREQWVGRAIVALNAVFPTVRDQGWEQWESCGRLLPHVLAVTDVSATQHDSLELASLLTKAADYLLQRAQYELAEPLYQRALHIYEQAGGREQYQVAFALNGLADLYREQGRYAEAEALYQRALHLWETLGQDDPNFPSPLNNLAILYQGQGNYQQAEQLLLRDLHFKEEMLGSVHPTIASILNNLAILYCSQGSYERAKPLLQRALRLDEQVYGQEHPEVAFSLNNLAELYRDQGLYDEAEPLYQRALRIREQALGHEHPLVAHPLNGLANLYREQGRYEHAEPLYQRALTIRYRQSGTQHPETAETLHDLARFYELRNQPDEALRLYRQALRIRERRLGPEHPHTRDTRTRYARLLRMCGRSEEAAAPEVAFS
jgi:tetratricopeptide (TPR) repeat protein/transcriptional regulator with XRE-family HTH domain